jgi:putative ABC transport system permease protein
MKTLRSIFRRKVRALLTVFGIAIGIFALVVMGSMAEKLNRLVSGGVEYYGTRITVQDAKAQFGFFGTNPVSISKIDEIKKIEGVKSAYPSIGMLMEEVDAVNFGMPPMIGGGDPKQEEDEPFKISYAKGRPIKEGDQRKVVIGQDLLNELDADVGDKIKLREKEFEVVGIMEKTFTAPDNMAIVNLPDAQELYLEDIPAAYRSRVKKEDLATSIEVFTKEGVDPNFVVEQINESVSDVKAVSPDEFKEQVASQTAIFNLIIIGSALIALIVGSFSIINTMIMSVTERIREIGIKKAIGASNARILREFILEAAVMGLMGGLIGLALGWGSVRIINSIMAESGQIIFLTTPRLAVGSVLFATFLGAASGLYPAWYAARLNPIQALRSE